MPRARSFLSAAVLALLTSPLAAQAGPWRSLLGGNSLAQWKGYRAEAVPTGWTVASGVLSKDRPVGDIVTRDQERHVIGRRPPASADKTQACLACHE